MLPHSQPLSIHQKMNFINTNVVSIVESFGQVRGQVGLEVLRGSSALCKGKESSHEFRSVSKKLSIIQNYHKYLSDRKASTKPIIYRQLLGPPDVIFGPRSNARKATLFGNSLKVNYAQFVYQVHKYCGKSTSKA